MREGWTLRVLASRLKVQGHGGSNMLENALFGLVIAISSKLLDWILPTFSALMHFRITMNASVFGVKRWKVGRSQHDQGPSGRRQTQLDIVRRVLTSNFLCISIFVWAMLPELNSLILYALPAWGTHLLSSQSGRIDAFFKRAYRCGLQWLASSLLLMISFTVLPLGCLRKCVTLTQPIALITSCHPSDLQIMFCVTVANPTSYHSATTSLIRTRLLIGVLLVKF